MKNLQEFKDSLKNENPDHNLSVQLKALWYDGKEDWNKAHHQVDQLNDHSSAHIHAYLHRKEGDFFNAELVQKGRTTTVKSISGSGVGTIDNTVFIN